MVKNKTLSIVEIVLQQRISAHIIVAIPFFEHKLFAILDIIEIRLQIYVIETVVITVARNMKTPQNFDNVVISVVPTTSLFYNASII